jgi:hypothetical protein
MYPQQIETADNSDILDFVSRMHEKYMHIDAAANARHLEIQGEIKALGDRILALRDEQSSLYSALEGRITGIVATLTGGGHTQEQIEQVLDLLFGAKPEAPAPVEADPLVEPLPVLTGLRARLANQEAQVMSVMRGTPPAVTFGEIQRRIKDECGVVVTPHPLTDTLGRLIAQGRIEKFGNARGATYCIRTA